MASEVMGYTKYLEMQLDNERTKVHILSEQIKEQERYIKHLEEKIKEMYEGDKGPDGSYKYHFGNLKLISEMAMPAGCMTRIYLSQDERYVLLKKFNCNDEVIHQFCMTTEMWLHFTGGILSDKH